MGDDWTCECADFAARQTPCKHIYACSFLPSLKVPVKAPSTPRLDLESTVPKTCACCHSTSIVKRGFVHEKGRKVQRYWCKECNRTFVPDLGFKKMKNDPKAITAALDAYFRGLSLRDVRDHLEQFYGVRVNQTTVLRWIQKYSKVISEYVNTLSPQLSDTWHADEVFVKMRGGEIARGGMNRTRMDNMAYLWNVMDRKTRFLLASKVTKGRDLIAAEMALTEAAQNAHFSEPEKILTDSLPSYAAAIPRVPFTKDPEHIAKAGIGKPHANNNRIERLNGTVRERVKVQRGWKSIDSALPEGHRIFYNFVRPHMALGEQTPAQAAGIGLGLCGNKWMELILKANESKASP